MYSACLSAALIRFLRLPLPACLSTDGLTMFYTEQMHREGCLLCTESLVSFLGDLYNPPNSCDLLARLFRGVSIAFHLLKVTILYREDSVPFNLIPILPCLLFISDYYSHLGFHLALRRYQHRTESGNEVWILPHPGSVQALPMCNFMSHVEDFLLQVVIPV